MRGNILYYDIVAVQSSCGSNIFFIVALRALGICMNLKATHPMRRSSLSLCPRPRLTPLPSSSLAAQESIVNMRRKLLVQRFVMALTSGQSSVRPIEMQAHDPVR